MIPTRSSQFQRKKVLSLRELRCGVQKHAAAILPGRCAQEESWTLPNNLEALKMGIAFGGGLPQNFQWPPRLLVTIAFCEPPQAMWWVFIEAFGVLEAPGSHRAVCWLLVVDRGVFLTWAGLVVFFASCLDGLWKFASETPLDPSLKQPTNLRSHI